jgi:hypothetical protein
MSELLTKLKKFFSLENSVSQGLGAYIESKNPKSHADIERLTIQYQTCTVCRRIL